jgi:hypothetical protein
VKGRKPVRCKHFFAVLSGLVAVALLAADAAAMYHPTLGRWLQRDPSGYADGMGLYEYGVGRPASGRDPQGLGWWEDTKLAGQLAGAYASRGLPPRGGYLGNLMFDWLLGPMDVDDQATAYGQSALPQNAEISSVVDSEMRAYAQKLCQDGRDVEYPRFTYNDQITIENQPLSGVLGTGGLSADGSGSVTPDASCSRTCKRVFVDADWRYEDEIDMLSIVERARRGDLSFWNNPFKVINYLPAIAEGAVDVLFDKIQDANYPFVVHWYKTLEGCCEEFDD